MDRIRRRNSIAPLVAVLLSGLLLAAPAAGGPLLYSNTSLLYTDAGHTQPAGALVGSSVGNPSIIMDDVLIPDSLLDPVLPLPVTRVTFGILRAPNAAAVDVTGYWTSLVTPVSDPNNTDANGFPLLNTPINSLGSIHLNASSSSVATVETISFGNGVDTLFSVLPAFDDPFEEGFGEFAVGMKMSAATSDNLWALIDPVTRAENGDFVWPASDVNTVGDAANLTIPDPQNPGQFLPVYAVLYMQIEGVPEPTSAALVGAGVLAGLLRRRRFI